MSYIPEFPISIKAVYFYGSNFTLIDRTLLRNVSINIHKVSFYNTSTFRITPDAFQGKKIKSLSIIQNRMLKVDRISFDSIPRKLVSLRLENNIFRYLPALLFKPFQKMHFNVVSFSGNKLTTIYLSVFGFMKINTLKLSNNRLYALPNCSFNTLVYVKTLDFDNNNFHGNLLPSTFQCSLYAI